MNDMTAKIGDNKPPIKDQLEMTYADIFRRLTELEAAAASVPAKIENDADAGALQDLVKMMRVAIKQADATRDAEKEPYAQAVKEVNATFKIPMDRLAAVQAKLMERYNAYLEEKKAAAALALAEEARKQREAAAAREKERQEAEARRLEAEKQEREARERAEKAERDRIAAKQEAERQEARAKAAREEAEREEARAAALKAKREADAALIAKVEADAEVREAVTEKREAAKDQITAEGQSVRLEKRAERIEEKIEDGAELSRTRGELGTVGSLAKRWTYRVTDYDKIPMAKLRPFIHQDAINAAIHRMMMSGVRELPGVVFEQIEEGRIG